MKKTSILLFVLSLAITILSCGYPGGSVSIKQSEYDHYWELTAKFNPDKTAAVDKLLDKELADGSMSFSKTEMDGTITLDDKSSFYIKKSPGFLNIKLDKNINTDEIYYKLKGVAREIGEVVR